MKFTITLGSIRRGKRRILNNEIATKALAAVSSLPSNTYTVKVARETCGEGR